MSAAGQLAHPLYRLTTTAISPGLLISVNFKEGQSVKKGALLAQIDPRTCGGDVDSKTSSKWARALRYASRRKEPDVRLKTFMKEAGGVNACADLYAKNYGRCVRQISQG